MRYEGKVYRPPSEADAFILQATIGCSWNKCTYCDMYREKRFRTRALDDVLADIAAAGQAAGEHIEKVFVADGDALVMDRQHWETILHACRRTFPNLRRVSCYAMATNILDKSEADLAALRDAGLTQLYIGPESGDDDVLKRIAKGSTAAQHIEAAIKARHAAMKLSVIFLLGAGGVSRSKQHAAASAELATAMDPEFLAALTLTVVPTTPIARAEEKGLFALPDEVSILHELRTFVATARPTNAVFRTNHASNRLPLGGRLPHDREAIVEMIDRALDGELPMRPGWMRGL